MHFTEQHQDDQELNECDTDTIIKSTRQIYLFCRSQHPRVFKDCLVYENLKTLVISQHGANIEIHVWTWLLSCLRPLST